MPKFSDRCKQILSTADHHLQVLFNEIIKLRECTILEPHHESYSKHNCNPSEEVDAAPSENATEEECIRFGNYVEGIIDCMNMRGKINYRVPYHYELIN